MTDATDESGVPADRSEQCISRRRLLATGGGVGAALVAGCLGEGASGDTDGPTGTASPADGMATGPSTANDDMVGGTGTVAGGSWRTTELTDVRTEETFTLDSFDRPVVLETFAVWCPRCTTQQEELAGVASRVGDDAVVVSVNTDPNEDAAKVRSHADEHGFDWRYAVAPPAMTKALVDAFGPTITNAPSTPVVVACPDGEATLMAGREITPASTIVAAVESC